ncbi:MAG: OmpA family protein [Pseudomonadota bacterium]
MARRRQAAAAAAEGGGSGGFAVLFTSLSVILLAFFILLNSLATMDGRRRRAALGSLVGSFGTLPGGFGLDPEGEVLGREVGLTESEEQRVFAAFSKAIAQGETAAELQNEGGRWTLRLRQDALFSRGLHEVNPRYFPILDRAVEVARQTNRALVVRGHADGGPLRQHNWLISARRAAAVGRFLIEAGGLPGNQVRVEGLGDTQADTQESKDSASRRVDVVFE